MLEITSEGERIVPSFCCTSAELAVRATRKRGICEAGKLIIVAFNVSFDAKALHRHAKKAEDCKRFATERTHDALSRRGFEKSDYEAQAGVSMGVLFFTKRTI